jgi:hypothetical protein
MTTGDDDAGAVAAAPAAEADAAQAAYDAWLARARADGRTSEHEAFAAGWTAGRDWAEAQRSA